MEIKNKIKKLLEEALNKLEIGLSQEKINLEHPDILEHGDYSSNIALVLAKKEGKNPREFAEQIRAQVTPDEEIEKIEIAGPGFINFHLSKLFYKNFLNRGFPENCCLNNNSQKILLEHSSPNLFKPFHIGHLVNNSIGESLSRILKFAGNEVKTVSFPSDVGPGIAKTIWALKKQGVNIVDLTLKQIAGAYVEGTKQYQENEKYKEEINQINIKIYQQTESESLDFYKKGKELSLNHFYEITKKLGSEFSDLIFESESEEIGKEIVKNNTPDIFEESEGAIIFPGSRYGLFDNVFINSQGFGTYLTKDIGLLKIKFNRYDFDRSLTITDIEQKQHFQLVTKVAELLNSEWAKKSKYLQHGRMKFAGQIKISSRYGNVPLVDDILKILEKKILENNDNLEDREVEKIAIAAIKYTILKTSSGKNIVFDLEKSLDFSGNSGPYLQYAYVRALSILNKSGQKDFFLKLKKRGEINNLDKKLYRFTEIVEKSLDDYSVHHLANYLYDLSSEFNSFYEQTKILDNKNEDYLYNLALIFIFSKILKKGLYLLGIETVEKM